MDRFVNKLKLYMQIPYSWNRKLVTLKGRSASAAVVILGNIWVNLNKQNNGKGFRTNYRYLSEVHGVSHEAIRMHIQKLEKVGLLRREFRDEVIEGRINRNVLYIYLGPNFEEFQKNKNARFLITDKTEEVSN